MQVTGSMHTDASPVRLQAALQSFLLPLYLPPVVILVIYSILPLETIFSQSIFVLLQNFILSSQIFFVLFSFFSIEYRTNPCYTIINAVAGAQHQKGM